MSSSNLRLSKLSLGLLAALAVAPVFAQSTSSGVAGRVTNAGGQPVAGAEVTITHVESGTSSRTVTDANGRYSANGLRVGGPYTVKVHSATGDKTEDGVFLGLDKVQTVDATVGAASGELGRVTVTGVRNARTFNSDNKGLSTTLNRAELERLPTPDRSIQNVVRMDPRVTVTDRDRGAFSANGQNFRYNSITVDNIQAGDAFGLNDNGLPTKGTPISQDAIESYNISTANFDVANRRGVGAYVNAVTKSGTNNFHGSVYYAYQNASNMIGKSSTTNAPWTGYGKNTTLGATFGGPILKDKLFFFASYEESKKTSPGSVYGPSDSNAAIRVPGVTQASVASVIAAAKAWGLNPGDTSGSGTDLTSKRALIKLDWNINDAHRVSLRASQTKEIEPILTAGFATGANPQLTLSSNWYVQNKKNTSYALSFYDNWTDNFSTEANIGYNDFKQVRGPLTGGYQPEVTVRLSGADTGSSIVLGTEYSSQANVLGVRTLNASFAGNWHLGAHAVKAGLDFQRDNFYNLFLQRADGAYEFNSIADFQNGIYRRYRYNAPAPGYTLDNVAAKFTQKQYGLYIQDAWQVTDRLAVTYGLRYDVPKVSPLPTYNPCFAAAPGTVGAQGPCGLRASTTNPNAAVGGYGYSNQGTIDGNSVLQPRFSFNYQLPTERKSQLRGGAGIFVSNTPAVWVANPYSNNGVAVTGYDVNRKKLATDPAFSPDANNQNVPGGVPTVPGLGSSSMNLAIVDKNFKIPTVAKITLGYDLELPWYSTVFAAEYQHIDTINGILYQNINIGAPTGVLPDGRYSYAKTPNAAPGGANTNRWNANPSFGQQMILLTNTKKGRSDSLTLALRKPFANNWAAGLAYTMMSARDVNPGTSSVANSSFQNRDWVGPNDDQLGVSNYAIKARVLGNVTWSHKFFGDNSTNISVLYDGHSGTPYSWIFGNDVNGDSYFRDLAYVPRNAGDVNWTANTTQQAKDSFIAYIQNDRFLSQNAGRVFRRNTARAPWLNQFDLSFRQELPGFMKGHKGELRLDIFNIGNLLNKKWGVEQRASFPLERVLADSAGVSGGKYVYDISKYLDANGNYAPQTLPVNESFNPSQRWSVMATLKYKF